MANIGGFDVPIDGINISGFASSSWIYIFIVAIIGVILITGVAILLFYKTFNKKIVIFENISGQGYQPLMKTRGRIVKLGVGGEEVMKTLAGGIYLTAYGRKMGKNTYWFCKAKDGYLYNVILGDVDTKLNMLDIDPVDRDVRMFHVALDRLSQQTYGKTSFFEKYAVHMLLFVFLIVLILGMWFIVGKVGDATHSLAATADTNKEVVQALNGILQSSSNIKSATTGIVPVPVT